jgi:hypothetical protein
MDIAIEGHDDVDSTETCYLLSLPSELLFKILSDVLPNRFLNTSLPDFEPLRPFFQTLRAARSVCQTFRSVVADLPFWYDKGFRFDLIIPRPPGPKWGFIPKVEKAPLYIEQMLRVDNHLKECLSQKKREWCITCRDMFEMFMRTIPDFKETAESLYLEYANNIESCVDLDELLKRFSRVRQLDFTTDVAHIHAAHLPASLRRLTISYEHKMIVYGSKCPCTMTDVQYLQRFELDYYGEPPVSGLEHLLPTRSSTTLRSLALGFSYCDQPISYSMLDLFRNVKELEVTIVSPSLFQYLPTSCLRLEVFKIRLDEVGALDGFAQAIYSPCLSPVKEFDVTLWPRHWVSYDGDDAFEECVDLWEAAIAAITKLPNLETICFDAPQKVDWSTYFKQCTRLQVLRWSYYVSEFYPPAVPKAFESALEHIHPKPLVFFDREQHP